MARRGGLHKVGLTAAAIGLSGMMLAPFAVVRPNRIAEGTGLSLLSATRWPEAVLLLGLWLAVVALSLAGGKRPWAGLARGMLASALIVAVVGVSGATAARLSATAGPFGRVSIGGGAWIAIASAWLLAIASAREAEPLGGWTRVLSLIAPAGVIALLASGALSAMGVMREYANVADRFWAEAANHATVSAGSLAVAVIVGLALGMLAFSYRRLSGPVLGSVSAIQTIPGLAMVGILVAPLSALAQRVPALASLGVGGIGWAPVAIALTLYALLVIVHNTIAGLRGVPANTTEAARALGLTSGQLMRRVRLPIAAPVVYTGVRTAALQTVGTATLGAFVGGWSLGRFVIEGMSEGAADEVLLGAVAIVVLALAFDAVGRAAQPLLIRARRQRAGMEPE